MTAISLTVFLYPRQILVCEEGQGLVEYDLPVALIAFGAIAGMEFLGTGINDAFSGIATTLSSNV